MNKKEENEKYFQLKILIITLIEDEQGLLWKFLVVEIFHFLHSCSYKLSQSGRNLWMIPVLCTTCNRPD